MTRIHEITTHKTALVSTDKFVGEEGGGTDFYTEFQDLISSLQAYLGDWVEVADSWSYASASTITVPSDATLSYQKGDRLRLKQGGAYKYFYVISIAATTLTVTGGSDYSVANAAITDVAYSRASRPFGFSDYFNISSVVSSESGSITSYTVNAARISIQGKTIRYFIDVTITDNGTGAGRVLATIPFTPSQVAIGSGVDNQSPGVGLHVVSAVSTLYIKRYDGAYPGGTGFRLIVRAEGEV